MSAMGEGYNNQRRASLVLTLSRRGILSEIAISRQRPTGGFSRQERKARQQRAV